MQTVTKKPYNFSEDNFGALKNLEARKSKKKQKKGQFCRRENRCMMFLKSKEECFLKSRLDQLLSNAALGKVQ